jgi:4-hydroxybenzoate polyprenyltransferase
VALSIHHGSIGYLAGRGAWYFAGLAAAAALAIHQQYLIRDRKPADCLAAFLNNNYYGMAVFLGLVADYAVS